MHHNELFDIFAAAAQVPEAPALVHARGQVSYAKLAELAARGLGWLEAQLGRQVFAGAKEPVAVLAVPSAEQVAMAFALFAGGIPLLPVHPRSSEREREQLLESVGARLLVLPRWPEQRKAVARAPVAATADGEATLALVQTSGSTSAARVARLSRRAFAASARASASNLGWCSGDRWLLALPFAHIGGLSILTRCLEARQAIALVDPKTKGERALAEALHELRPTLLSLVPTQLERLLTQPDWSAPPSLRATLVGGAACSEATLARARARGMVPLASYGLTEACSQVCTRSLASNGTEAGVGHPLAGIEVRVDDGAIDVRGPTLFSGYGSDTAARQPSEWFATGDLGHFDQHGCLHVTGRRDDRIITGGENVSPAEIEAVLAPALAPRRMVVFGRADPTWGEMVAIAVEGPHDPELVATLLEISRRELASYKWPRAIAFVERMPELPSGKLDRRAVREACMPKLVPLDYRAKAEMQ